MTTNIDFLFNKPFRGFHSQNTPIDSNSPLANNSKAQVEATKISETISSKEPFQFNANPEAGPSIADNISVIEYKEGELTAPIEEPSSPSFKEYVEKIHRLYSLSLSTLPGKNPKSDQFSQAVQKSIPAPSWLYNEDLACKHLLKIQAQYRQRFSERFLKGKSAPSLISYYCHLVETMYIPGEIKNSESFAKKIIDIDPGFIGILSDSARLKVHCDHEFIQNIMDEHAFSTTLEQADWDEFWKFALNKPENVQFLREAFSSNPSYLLIFSTEVNIAVAFDNPVQFEKATADEDLSFEAEKKNEKLIFIAKTALKYPHIKEQLDMKAQQLKSYSAALQAILQQEEERQSPFHLEVRDAFDVANAKKNILDYIEKVTNNKFTTLTTLIKNKTLFRQIDQRFGNNEAWVRSAVLAHPNAIMIASDSVRAKIACDRKFILKVLNTCKKSNNICWSAFWEAIRERFPDTRLFFEKAIIKNREYLYTFGIEGILTYAFTQNDFEKIIEEIRYDFPAARKAELRTGLFYHKLAHAYPEVLKTIEEEVHKGKTYTEVLEKILEIGKNLRPKTSNEEEIVNFYNDAQVIPYAVQVPEIIETSLAQHSDEIVEKDVVKMIKEQTLFAAIDQQVRSSKIWLREAVMTHPNALYLASDKIKEEIAQDTQFINQVLSKFKKTVQNIDWNAFWNTLKSFSKDSSIESLAFMESKLLEDSCYVTTFSSEGIWNLAFNSTKTLSDIHENAEIIVSKNQKRIIQEALTVARIIQKYPEIQKTLELEHKQGTSPTAALKKVLDQADKKSEFYLEIEQAAKEYE